MGRYFDGDYDLDLQVEYKPKDNLWYIVDKSENYPYSYFWKQRTKPVGKDLRERLSYCYYEARNYFEWDRM